MSFDKQNFGYILNTNVNNEINYEQLIKKPKKSNSNLFNFLKRNNIIKEQIEIYLFLDHELINLLNNYIKIKKNINIIFELIVMPAYKMNRKYQNMYKFECEYSIYYIKKIIKYIIFKRLKSKVISDILKILFVEFDFETYKLKKD